jgi:uncharacterized membrane protein
MDGKTKAIIAHITLIGWIIALVLNSSDKDELASYYIRQMLGLMIFSLLSMIPGIVGSIFGIVAIVFWILSLISAVQGEMKPLPVIGEHFQDWFKSL